jgi:hypothetical protein
VLTALLLWAAYWRRRGCGLHLPGRMKGVQIRI